MAGLKEDWTRNHMTKDTPQRFGIDLAGETHLHGVTVIENPSFLLATPTG